jgi:hypothetical protein
MNSSASPALPAFAPLLTTVFSTLFAALLAAPAAAQGNDGTQADGARAPIVWATMDAMDLSNARLRWERLQSPRPLVAFEPDYIERSRTQNAAAIDRMRTRMAERLARGDNVPQPLARNTHP